MKVYFEADTLGYLPEWYNDKPSFEEGDLVGVSSGHLTPNIHAALKLKQGFGRLIRSRQDVGVVVLLDRRVVTKR